jgi:hypothetical protein
MKNFVFFSVSAVLVFCSASHCETGFFNESLSLRERQDLFLRREMIPLAKQFIHRNGLPSAPSDLRTNDLKRCEIEFPGHWHGIAGDMILTNGYEFNFLSDGTNTDICGFSSGIKTTYNLENAPNAKIEAVRALNAKNRLNNNSALSLAKYFFKLQGHKEDDFHPPIFGQYRWGEPNEADYVPFPFYMAQWYRKDVRMEEREEGRTDLPMVMIEVSGITSNLVSYQKYYLPFGIGRDFEPQSLPWIRRSRQTETNQTSLK